jgi:prephenate dehydrogenase
LSKPRPLGRVAIIGTGQIGGSMALRLKHRKAAHIIAFDYKRSVLSRARKMRLAHEYTGSLAVALAQADLVVLALPVASIIAALMDPDIPFRAESVVMDVGSTKRLIMAAANRRRPPLRFVGGHPLAGNERIGLDGAEANLFCGAAFPVLPGRGARAANVATVKRLVRELGAKPMDLDAAAHDRITGLTIGLPHMLAFMVRDVYEQELKKDKRTALLAGSSIWSTMRVSNSDPTMVGDFIATNRDQIEQWWRRMTGASVQRHPIKKGRPGRPRN